MAEGELAVISDGNLLAYAKNQNEADGIIARAKQNAAAAGLPPQTFEVMDAEKWRAQFPAPDPRDGI